LKLEPLGGRLAEGLRSIHKSALDGAEVVRRIQDFTRVTERRDFEPVDLSELVEDVLDMTRAIWRDKAQRLGITYHIQRHCHQALWVMGNASELREVLHNLIINALDAMPSGGELRLEGKLLEGRVRLLVRDQGHGMTAEVLERIFDPFFTTKGARGNGLGLSVSYGIVERHGGGLGATSTPGEGSEFTLLLPPANEDQLSAALPRVESAELPRALISRRVLVVDDEPDVRGVLVDALRLMGHHVDEAASGQEGLDLWQRERHSHIFTDLGMPGINGWELADRIRSQLADSQVAPVIILVTGWGAQIREEDQRVHQVDHVLPKPFKIRDLARLVQEPDPPLATP
jgi:CheY-like chemotaxis protein/anti-sigma regulatory factor (Ser/Thr protein kinase)